MIKLQNGYTVTGYLELHKLYRAIMGEVGIGNAAMLQNEDNKALEADIEKYQANGWKVKTTAYTEDKKYRAVLVKGN